ncbi:VWA-like domain-containing protein [Propionicimonas sp.]|uniref:vWA domain-containing protein n=1 Tax=Propionicimonas sp. TaxID=1955623 RepID=UPI0017FF4037|nr:VWA-like domain-containing protein [Propionicimonas sp.]MBA3019613.1 hypothetical protein [Propionicimonas sp.]MBU4208042.1 hypothetical protein [Actinomycetota bacterium]MBU4411504.1 hypothetical protein [Actinomycetota bacterium]MCG2805732.1 VWA-like domain-containing protein [Propionicimonas sp.]
MSELVRALRPDEWEAFRLARLVAAEWQPYLMHAMFAVQPVAAPGLGTFAVDGEWRLYLDPARLVGPDRWLTPLAAGVLLHEIGHLIRDHAGRAAQLPLPRHRLAWNLAGDAEINDDLIAASVPLPVGVVTPDALGCEDGDLAEVYYRALTARRDLPDDGGDGCGSGSGCAAVRGELPAGVGLGEGVGVPVDPAAGDMVRRRVAAAVREALEGVGRGSVPAGMARWAQGVLAPPVIGWDRLLASAIRRGIGDRAGRVNYTYRRPSRRQVPGIVRPAMRAPLVRVSVVVDTSGSMSQSDLDAAMGEVGGVLRSSGVARDGLRLVSCDAAAATSRRVRQVSSVELVGGGGTDMRVGIAAAESDRPAPDVVIVLTDGDTPWPDAPGRAHLICAVISRQEPDDTPEWATTVHIPVGRLAA